MKEKVALICSPLDTLPSHLQGETPERHSLWQRMDAVVAVGHAGSALKWAEDYQPDGRETSHYVHLEPFGINRLIGAHYLLTRRAAATKRHMVTPQSLTNYMVGLQTGLYAGGSRLGVGVYIPEAYVGKNHPWLNSGNIYDMRSTDPCESVGSFIGTDDPETVLGLPWFGGPLVTTSYNTMLGLQQGAANTVELLIGKLPLAEPSPHTNS